MSITVEFLGPIEQESIQVEATSIKELAIILNKNPKIQPWLDKSAIAINDHIMQDKNCALKANDKVSILPPVCGG